MTRPYYSSVLLHGWTSILMFAVVGFVLALIVSFLQPLRYSSTARLLILEDVGTTDAYTASRSIERIAENLATVVYTTSFYDEVMGAGFDIDKNVFSSEDYKQRREWSKMVSATVARGSGLLTIAVYHQDIAEAEQIVKAISFVLTQQAGTYTSGGNIEVRLVDAPLNSRWPAKPNIPANAFSGLVLGGLVGVGFLLLRAERIRRRHQLVHEDLV